MKELRSKIMDIYKEFVKEKGDIRNTDELIILEDIEMYTIKEIQKINDLWTLDTFKEMKEMENERRTEFTRE